jgi:ADP-ribose pyrophosphatase YjhB (NUDIX family)
MKYPWLEVARELQAIAQEGLTYTEGKYDRIRYERLSNIAVRILSDFSDSDMEMVRELFATYTRYPTPKIDVRAAVFQGNKILMVREETNHLWSLPGGWADIGLTPSENAVKEVREESGLEVKPVRLLALWDKKCHPHAPPEPDYVYKVVILCARTGGELRTSIETTAVGWFEKTALPPLSVNRNTESQVLAIFEAVEKERPVMWD